jgi:hypothetical protein
LWIKDFENDDYASSGSLHLKGENTLQISPNVISENAALIMNLKRSGKVQINLYDISGKLAKIILEKEMNSGKSTISWNRQDLPSGIYLCTFTTTFEKLCGKIILM